MQGSTPCMATKQEKAKLPTVGQKEDIEQEKTSDMNKVKITKEEFLSRFNAAKKRKQELVKSLQQELMNEHISSTGYTATNIYVM